MRTRPRPGRKALPSGVFVGLVALFVTFAAMAWVGYGSARLNVFAFVLTGWIISLCLHEYGHAVLAWFSGDHGVLDRGYLTLNPLRYAHPVLSVVLPVVFLLLGGIGLPGGAVWVDHHMIGSRARRSAISLIGPTANLGLALVIAITVSYWSGGREAFWAGLAFLGFLQVTAALLNFLPIPGVDGGNAVEPWLNAQWRRGFGAVAPYGMLLLFALLSVPVINVIFFSIVDSVGAAIGLPDGLVATGYRMFQFWRS